MAFVNVDHVMISRCFLYDLGDNVHKLQRMEELIGDRRRVEDERSLIKTPSDVQANNQEHDSPTSTHQIRSVQPGSPCFVYTLAFFSALGGFLFGYDTGVVSGAMLLLKREMNLSSLWQELLVSITVGAAAVSSLVGGYLNGLYGRRICILLASFIFSAGGIIMSVAHSKEVLLCGRLTVGLGIGKLYIVKLFEFSLCGFSFFACPVFFRNCFYDRARLHR